MEKKIRIGTTMDFQVQNVPTARSIDTAGSSCNAKFVESFKLYSHVNEFYTTN